MIGNRKSKIWLGLTLAVLFAMLVSTLAMADDIYNNLDTSIDAVAEVMPLNAGGVAGTTDLYLEKKNEDGKQGCNLQGTNEYITFSVISSDPSVATVLPGEVTFDNCADTFTLTVTPLTEGSTTISLAPKAILVDKGTFDWAPATFIVNVAPAVPSNTAPQISISDVTGGASYEIGSVPAATCMVTDAEDGDSSFLASLSDISGDLSVYGLGEQTASCSYTDAGGLTAEASITYSIVDTVAPVITFFQRTPANASGWNNTDVTVVWTCTDTPGSGVVSETVSQTLSAEGEDQSATGACVDHAGNTASASLSGIYIDKTAPAIAFQSRTPANANNWNNGDVTVQWSCTDGGSGVVADTVTAVKSAEGRDQTATGSCQDLAGNTATDTQTEINIDLTAPVFKATLDKQPDVITGWYNIATGAPTVSFECSDALSGIDGACPASFTFGEGADQSYSQTVYDLAGNSASDGVEGIKVDLTAPVFKAKLTPANPASTGWYNLATGAPTVSFECSDALSGIDGDCPASFTFGEGADQSYFQTVKDQAGNESVSAGVSGIHVDLTAPTIEITIPDNYGICSPSTVTPSYVAVDTLSGIASDDGVLEEPTTGSGVGTYVYTVTAADNAGNVATDEALLQGHLRRRLQWFLASHNCRWQERLQARQHRAGKVPDDVRRCPGRERGGEVVRLEE